MTTKQFLLCNPMLRIALVFILGIVMAYYWGTELPPFFWQTMIILTIVAFFFFRSREIMASLLLFICSFSVGGWRLRTTWKSSYGSVNDYGRRMGGNESSGKFFYF